MKKSFTTICLALSCLTLVSAGCAKKDMVRSDEPVTAVTTGAAEAGAATKAAAGGEDAQASATATAQADPSADSAAATENELLQSVNDAGKIPDDLGSVHFDFDSYLLSVKARETLVENAEVLTEGPQIKVRIAGHCDERGSDEYNLALSEQRARSAMNYLIGLGVAAERLSVIGYGKERPLAKGHDEESWAQNRRDDFELIQP